MTTSDTANDPLPLERGLSEADEVSTYANGECHFFALAVNRLTGLPLAYVASRRADGRDAVGHVVAVLPDGRVVDAEGIWAREDLLAHWGASHLVDVTPETVEGDLADEAGPGAGGLSPYCRERIDRAVRLLEIDESAFLTRLLELAPPRPPSPTAR